MSKHKALELADWVADDMTCEGDELIASTIRRQHALIVQMQEALRSAFDHLEMHKLQRSHCKDADRILQARFDVADYLGEQP